MFEGLFQPLHLLLIAALTLLFFGPKRLPQFGKVIGDGVRGLTIFHSRDETSEDQKEQSTVESMPRVRGTVAGINKK